MSRLFAFVRWLLPVALLLVVAGAARAEVVASSAGGFSLRHEATVPLRPAELFELLTGGVSSWWEGSHSFSADASNLYFDLEPGGCFCERLPSGGWVRHLEVVFLDPPRRLALRGGLGPLQAIGASGTLSWQLEASEEGTRLTLDYVVSGFQPDGLAVWAAPVDGVLGLQFGRLVAAASP